MALVVEPPGEPDVALDGNGPPDQGRAAILLPLGQRDPAELREHRDERVSVADEPVGYLVHVLGLDVCHASSKPDDGPARRAAEDHGIALRPALALLCEAIRDGLLTVALVSALADDLLISAYRLPFGPGGFEEWAADNGLV